MDERITQLTGVFGFTPDWLKYIIAGLLVILVVQFVWRYSLIYRKRNRERAREVLEEFRLVRECRDAIAYFARRSKPVATLSISAALNPTSFGTSAPTSSPVKPAVGDTDTDKGTESSRPLDPPPGSISQVTITHELSRIENELESAFASVGSIPVTATPVHLLDPSDRSVLRIIHSFLATQLNLTEGDVSIETAGNALNERLCKLVSSSYMYAALYVMLLAVLQHSFVSCLDRDHGEATSAYNTFANLVSEVMSPQSLGATTTTDSTDFAARMRVIEDSLTVTARVLQQKLKWIQDEMKFSPFNVRQESEGILVMHLENLSPPMVHSLLSTGDLILYSSAILSENMKLFILPMFYGLIGAFLYVIRRLSEEIKAFDFTWTKTLRNSSRLLFGLFVGMFFGYLFRPTQDVDTAEINSISTFVIAFVGGYHIEILFSAMDKVVTAFSTRPNATPVDEISQKPT